MRYRRTPIEIESPEQLAYATIENNLAESSFTDMRLADYGVEADLGELLLPYGDHLGLERLRALIAGAADALAPDDVLVTAGAAAALFVVSSAVICAPNYVTNIETPRAIGATVETLQLRFEDRWQLDLDQLASRLRRETRLVSVTYPHNPTGSSISRADLERLVEIVESHPTA